MIARITYLLDYFWRLLGTGISFIAFGIGGLILTFIVFPLIHLRSRDEKEKNRVSRALIHQTFRGFIWFMSALGVIRFDLEKARKKLCQLRGKIVIANHPSLIDVVALIAIMPDADCIIKESLWDNIFIKGVISAAGYIKNTGDINSLIEACDKSLQAGYSLIIFPEGTRTPRNGDITLQRGASNIALRCGVDVVSVLIYCTPTTLTKHEPWYRIPSTRVYFRVQMGKTFEISEFEKNNKSLSINARILTEKIRNYFVSSIKIHD